MSTRKVKYIDKDLLAKINHVSHTIYKYNRTIIPEAIDALPDDKLFPVVFTMLHEHKAGEPCEPHVRVMFAVPTPGNDTGLMDRMLLDMDTAFFDMLPEVEVPDETPSPEMEPAA